MSWKNVKLIFSREVRDQFRDRRTLFMVIVLPLLMYPALGIGMVQMTVLFTEQPRTVVVLGADDLPEDPALIAEGHFSGKLFPLRESAATLNLVTDRSDQEVSESKRDPDSDALLKQAEEIREKHKRRDALEARLSTARDQKDSATVESTRRELHDVNRELSRLFQQSDMQVLILVPERFRDRLEAENRLIAERKESIQGTITTLELPILHNRADKKSQIAFRRVNAVIDAWKTEILKKRLNIANLPAALPTPVSPKSVDLADEEEVSDSLWSSIFPALLVIMAVTGAFYPAVDLVAGEKERGTMETLLICPAARTEIVMGKFLTVMLFSITTALLNLVSMGLTGKYIASLMASSDASGASGLTLPSWIPLIWVLILLIPLSALFSALCLALATFARSSKEGQYYLTPLLMITMGLTIFCLSPGVEITPFYSIMPVIGPALLLKELFVSPGARETLAYLIPVLMTSLGYSLLALWWAIDQFSREEVLFREAERFELRLWFRNLFRNKESMPGFSEAGFCFVFILMLQFGSLKYFSEAFLAAESSREVLQLQMISLLLTIAGPALLMGILLTTSVVKTFRLRLPKWNVLAAAAILPLMLHPLTVEMFAHLDWFFPQLPPGATRILESMSKQSLPLWFVLLAFALTPAVCEELAFRGFLLSGFSQKKRVGLAILFSSLAFGIVHMIPQQVFNATLLGLVLGLLTVRGNSLLPAILFHFLYNSMQVVRSRVDTSQITGTPAEWFLTVETVGDTKVIRYDWPTLLIAAVVAVVLLRWLLKQTETAATAAPTLTPPAVTSADVEETEPTREPPVSVP